MARFASTRGYSRSSLERWARAQRGTLASAPKFVRVEMVRQPGLIVEVGTARIRVNVGFDGPLLRQVVAALEREA